MKGQRRGGFRGLNNVTLSSAIYIYGPCRNDWDGMWLYWSRKIREANVTLGTSWGVMGEPRLDSKTGTPMALELESRLGFTW